MFDSKHGIGFDGLHAAMSRLRARWPFGSVVQMETVWMWPYWIMFIIPATVAWMEAGSPVYSTMWRQRFNPPWWLVLFTLTIIIGFRYQVGGDWGSYTKIYNSLIGLDLDDSLDLKLEPGYALINVISYKMDWGIFGVNIICGFIFSTALVIFSLHQPRPWLAFCVLIPYYVIVAGMGYTRQGVASAFILLGLLYLIKNKFKYFLLYIFLAVSFHKSAIIMLPIGALCAAATMSSIIFWIVCTVPLAIYVLNTVDAVSAYSGYVTAQMQSSGAIFRLLMTALSAAICIIFINYLFENDREKRIWNRISIFSILLFFALLITPSSTILDRIGLYFVPLQGVVFGRLPGLIGINKMNFVRKNKPGMHIKGNEPLFTSLIILIYAFFLYVWLSFGDNSLYWVPYRLYIFDDAFFD